MISTERRSTPIDSPDTTRVELGDAALDQLFRQARSYSFWQPRMVEESVIRRLYDLVKFGPTSANTSPARFVFVMSDEAKARLVPLMPEMNQEKTRAAPVVVLIAYDLKFYDKLDKLMPHRDYKPWFTGNPAAAERTAKQSGTPSPWPGWRAFPRRRSATPAGTARSRAASGCTATGGRKRWPALRRTPRRGRP